MGPTRRVRAVIGVQTVVIGAGVIDLAIARALAQPNCEVLLIKKEGVIGAGTALLASGFRI